MTLEKTNFIQLPDFLLEKTVENLPKIVKEAMRQFDIYLCGGYIRDMLDNQSPKDIDFFCKNINSAELGAKYLENNNVVIRRHDSANAITLDLESGEQVQFITRWLFDGALEHLEMFDFTHVRAAIWYIRQDRYTGWVGICDDRFVPDVTNKRLRYCAPIRDEEAAGCVLRMKKFLERGYKIDNDSLCKILARISKPVFEKEQHNEITEEYLIEYFREEIEKVYAKGRGY